MGLKTKLRLISLLMLVIAVIFIACALSNPALGHTITIGGLRFSAEQWQLCYAAYITVMLALFGSSFFMKR